jgi:GNAT superfamily N-acetyltransferase
MSVLATPPVTVATLDDIPSLIQLRLHEGWHRNDALLAALTDWDGGRIFIVRAATRDATPDSPAAPDPDVIVASTSALAAGPIGVVGNVVVREGFRGAGLGRLVMESTLDWMRQRGVRAVYLDATSAGRPLYYKLGFVGVGRSWFAQAPLRSLDLASVAVHAGQSGAPQVAHRDPTALSHIAGLDLAAFGGDRLGLLQRILAQGDSWLYIADDPTGTPAGYTLLRLTRTPSAAVRLGPLVATTPAAAASLMLAALGDDAPWRLSLDPAEAASCRLDLNVPGTNPDALALVQQAGAHLELDDLIMRLDMEPASLTSTGCTGLDAPPPGPTPAHPNWLYAWLVPMVF